MIPARLTRSARRTSMSMRSNSTIKGRPVSLPRLPVPTLRNTLDKYLKSIQPFLLEDEMRGGPAYASTYGARVKWADDFEKGVGRNCQERLLALDRESPYNWLDDNIWMKKAYHEWRAPLLVNSNWWLAFIDDHAVPEDVVREALTAEQIGLTPWQLRRAAWLVHRILDFKERLDTQELYPEATRAGIWLRENVAKMFNVSRIPQKHCDTVSLSPPPSSPDARKLFIMVHNWCYAIEVYDQQHERISVTEIERRLRAVVADVTRRLEQGERAVPLGVLSADERDRWAENLQYLSSIDPSNHSTLRTIQHSLFGLSLDHYTYTLPADTSHSHDPQRELDGHLHNIRSGRDAHNRWFDKAFTLVVESNARAGATGEHSPCDALVPSIVADYALVQGVEAAAFADPVSPDLTTGGTDQGGWERLEWVVDEKIRKECVAAEARAKTIIADSDDSVLWFTGYGADWIKDTAKLSPDAYLQMVLQLAWYKTRGEFTATYETALTRMFQHGRTETIRTLTTDSRAFVLAMVDPSFSNHDRYTLLRRAVQTHASLTREAATGRGIDRHLLGLRLMLQPGAGEPCDLFDDPLFERSQQWKLSTSGLSAGHQFKGTGFGAAYHDGYGINYLAGPEIVKFGIESKHSSLLTSTGEFQKVILEALDDMRTVSLVGMEDDALLSRL